MSDEILTNSLFKENIFKYLWKSVSENIFEIYMTHNNTSKSYQEKEIQMLEVL